MDLSTIISIGVSVILMGFGWLLRVFWDMIKNIEDDLDRHKQYAVDNFVRRDDYKTDMQRLESLVRQILDKLDDKQDK